MTRLGAGVLYTRLRDDELQGEKRRKTKTQKQSCRDVDAKHRCQKCRKFTESYSSKVLDSEPVEDEGEGGAAMFDGTKTKVK